MNDSLSKALQVHFKSGPNDMNVLCYCSEFINRLLLILFAWIEYHRREVGVIGRIGEVLSFKTDTASSWEGGPMLSLVAVCPVVGATRSLGCFLTLETKHLILHHAVFVRFMIVILPAKIRGIIPSKG